MVSALGDLRGWARAVATGKLLFRHATIVVLINSGPEIPHLPVFLLGNAITKVVTPGHVIIKG